jgi:uncharacterized protein (TIGR02996 family)
MTPEEAFLADIIESPDDDGLRLIYADWLEDHGARNRADFIRVQIELARLGEGDPRRGALKAKEQVLMGKQWGGPLPLLLHEIAFRWTFHRGFVEELSLEGWKVPTHAEQLFRLAPIRHLTLFNSRHDIERLAAVPQLTCLTSLDLCGNSLSDEGTCAFAASPYLSRLRTLVLNSNGIGDAGVGALAACPYLPRLATLTLLYNRIGDAGALALARSAHLQEMRSLNVCHNPIGKEGRQALQARFGDGLRVDWPAG